MKRYTHDVFDSDPLWRGGRHIQFKIRRDDIDAKDIQLPMWDPAGIDTFSSLPSDIMRQDFFSILCYEERVI